MHKIAETLFHKGASAIFFICLVIMIASCNLAVAQDKNLVDSVGCNGRSDLNVGVQCATGHNWQRFIINTGASVVVAFGVKSALKGMISEERPDHSDNKSFPSGHAAIAFAAARSIDKELRKVSVWIPIAGYAAATAVGIERVVNKRHHWYDVVAGAAVGIGSAELTWWLSDKIFGNGKVLVGTSGNTIDVAYTF